jgi:hypothetical protein
MLDNWETVIAGCRGGGQIKAGLRLVVGGGRAPGFPEPEPEDISINIEPWTRPSAVADIAVAPFASRTFSDVFFERIPFMVLTR